MAHASLPTYGNNRPFYLQQHQQHQQREQQHEQPHQQPHQQPHEQPHQQPHQQQFVVLPPWERLRKAQNYASAPQKSLKRERSSPRSYDDIITKLLERQNVASRDNFISEISRENGTIVHTLLTKTLTALVRARKISLTHDRDSHDARYCLARERDLQQYHQQPIQNKQQSKQKQSEVVLKKSSSSSTAAKIVAKTVDRVNLFDSLLATINGEKKEQDSAAAAKATLTAAPRAQTAAQSAAVSSAAQPAAAQSALSAISTVANGKKTNEKQIQSEKPTERSTIASAPLSSLPFLSSLAFSASSASKPITPQSLPSETTFPASVASVPASVASVPASVPTSAATLQIDEKQEKQEQQKQQDKNALEKSKSISGNSGNISSISSSVAEAPTISVAPTTSAPAAPATPPIVITLLESRIARLEQKVVNLESQLQRYAKKDKSAATKKTLSKKRNADALQSDLRQEDDESQDEKDDKETQPSHKRMKGAMPTAFVNMIKGGVEGDAAINNIVWFYRRQNASPLPSKEDEGWQPLPKHISDAIQHSYENYALNDRKRPVYSDSALRIEIQFVGMFGKYNGEQVRFRRSQ